MRALLGRHVSRRVLVQGGRIPQCSILLTPTCRRLPLAVPIYHRVARRTFFGIFQKPPRAIKKPEYEPGWTTILTWRNRLLDNLRPPTRKELVEAFRELYVYKLRFDAIVNSTQALHCRNLLTYLVENKSGEEGEGLTLVELTAAREALLKKPREDPHHHLEFSKALYVEIQNQRRLEAEYSISSAESSEESTIVDDQIADDFKSYVRALTYYGGSLEAVAAIRDYDGLVENTSQGKGWGTRKMKWTIWGYILQGLAHEGREKELLAQLAAAKKAGVPLTSKIMTVMITFYARRDRIEETKRWYETLASENAPKSPEVYDEILTFSFRNGLQEWARPIFQDLADSNPKKLYWDKIYQWAVLCMGKGVEDLKEMFEVVAKHNPDNLAKLPNVQTINLLIEVALLKEDPYLVERLLSLATEMGIRPDATTILLQMDHRIKVKDLPGARASYLQLNGVEIKAGEDLPTINRYLQALCWAEQPDMKAIREVMDVLEERFVTLDPETVVALCTVFLKMDQQFDVIDTLSLNVFQHSNDQRKLVRDALVKYCLDTKISTARVWDAYSILRQFFLETSVESRLKLMDAFFARNRPDMASKVFGHMRQHVNAVFHPTREAYTQCFEGLGKGRDIASLIAVHNMLKMDTKIQPSTQLYTSLMIAYARCGRPGRALEFWATITSSAEGPSYNSLEAAFYACEKKPFGDEIARDIWKQIEKLEVEVPRSVFVAYCGGIAGNGNVQEVQGIIKRMEETVGYGPNLETLLRTYNCFPGEELQAEFEAWAKKEYPALWDGTKQRSHRTLSTGVVKYKVDRQLKA